jgi:hypothetical protein
MRTCTICDKVIRRNEPYTKGCGGRGPNKHISCIADQPIDYTKAEESLLIAMRELKRARFEIRTHRWRDARPMILQTIDACATAVKHLAFWEAST